MELIKTISLVMFLLIAGMMLATLVCQYMTMRFVQPERRGLYKKAIRKFQFEYARDLVAPEGWPWLDRVRVLINSSVALLAVAAFTALGIIVFGVEAPKPS